MPKSSSIDNEYVVVDAVSPVASENSEEAELLDELDALEELDNLGDEPYYEKALQEIARGDIYPCMICTVEMDFTCHMYACPECYRVFDYECIREWAVKSTQKSISNTWKCPNCYFEKREVPLKNRQTCWCGKTVHPEANPLDPNSCGQTCDAPICVHGCSRTCHLGPHPTCMRMVESKCLCGKQSKEVFCSEASEHRESFRCKERCGLLLPCGIHECQQECHAGLCGECPENIDNEVKCYCGSSLKNSIFCKDVVIQGRSQDESQQKWIGAFPCETMRTVEYSCGQHSFTESCIAPPTLNNKVACPFSPKFLKTCPCGRNPLGEMNTTRLNCTDPIPTCDSVCGKRLKCGKHYCPFQCHTGACMQDCVCLDKVNCSCHAKSFLVPCKFNERAKCGTKCESLMSCRRHRCIERCCEGRSLASKREKKVFLTRDKLDESLVEAQHICLKQCNLKLKCGRHFCQRKCHPGSCPPCLESDSNDLVCPCGKTVVPAPVRCGTSLPRCLHPCIKTLQGPLECGHPPMPHPCHPLNEACPSCTAPVFKKCKCGKNDKVRTLCFQNNVSCGRVCGKKLPSCSHTCQRTCHEDGDCQLECKQVCGAIKPACGHRCRFKCHPGAPCPDGPCSANITITCPCERRTAVVPCGAHTGEGPVIERTLSCTDECEIARRHAELMEAFGIKGEESQEQDKLENFETLAEKVSTFQELMLPFSEASISIYAKQITWCNQIEGILKRLIDDKSKSSLHFKPMRPPQRHFIHELAQAYSLYCESQDQEPKRSCFVKKTANSANPSLSLQEALPLYQLFKASQKERKLKELERSTTTRLFNYSVNEDALNLPVAKVNGLLVEEVFPGVDEKAIEIQFQEILKHTLLKEPRYTRLSSGDILICTENYEQASVNVESDINRIVGHLNLFAKDHFLAEVVKPCQVAQVLESQVSASSNPDVD